MKRNVIVSAIAVALLASMPGWAAAPFGSFGGIVGGGNSGAGSMPLTGWALDDNGVLAVDILVDGFVAGRATYGRARAGVTARFPGYPDSAAAGFAFQLDTTHYLNGQHTVAVRVKSRAGEVAVLPSQVITFTNVEHDLAPFGTIEFPKPQAELRGNCNVNSPIRRYAVISGYALDAGTTQNDTGVAYVELLIDRAVGLDPWTASLQLRPRVHLLRREGRPDRLLRHPPGGHRADLPEPQGQPPQRLPLRARHRAAGERPADSGLSAALQPGPSHPDHPGGRPRQPAPRHRRDPGHLHLRPEPAE